MGVFFAPPTHEGDSTPTQASRGVSSPPVGGVFGICRNMRISPSSGKDSHVTMVSDAPCDYRRYAYNGGGLGGQCRYVYIYICIYVAYMGDGFREGRYTSTRPSFTGELLLRPNPPTCRVQTRRGPVACVVLGRSGGEFHTPEQRPQWDGLQGFVRVKKVGRYLPAASVRGHLAGYLHTTYRSPDRAPLGSARYVLFFVPVFPREE